MCSARRRGRTAAARQRRQQKCSAKAIVAWADPTSQVSNASGLNTKHAEPLSHSILFLITPTLIQSFVK